MAGVSANALAGQAPGARRAQTPASHSAAPDSLASALSNTPPVTEILSEWLVACPPSAVPESVRKEAVRSIVNWVGATLGGANQQAVARALAALAPLCHSSAASLFGRTETVDVLRAALITGISSHVLDFDDTHLPTIIHPAGPVASALFALAQQQTVSGADLLHAFILGAEVECRLGKAIYPSHYQMGWHITGTCGAFGAAAACGRILGLTVEQMEWALGLAATEAAGLKISFGSMAKSLNIGRAAENGLLAALLAQKNFTASEQAIEGRDGYIFAASQEHNYGALIDGLGQHYEIALNTYKPYACGIVLHPVIDAMLALRQQHTILPDAVRSINIRANPLVIELTGKKSPSTGLEGKFSVYYTAASALIRGLAGPREYTDQAVQNPQVVALEQRVKVETDSAIRTEEAYVSVTINDGHTWTEHVEHALGSVKNPLSDHDLSTKFTQLAQGILPRAQAQKLLTATWNFAAMKDAGNLPRLGALSSRPAVSTSKGEQDHG